MPGPLLSRRALLGGIAVSLVPLIRQAGAEDGFRVLTPKPGTARLRGADQPATPTWGYDGLVPGPTLRLRQGEELKVRVVNGLDQPTAVHWHGLRIANAMDGAAGLTQPPIPPGKSFDYRFTPPDAGTFWYHPHGNTGEQIGRGLYGLLIVEEREPVAVDQDIALVLSDWRLDDTGQIAPFGSMHDAAHQGRYGNLLTANSRPSHDIPVRAHERIRLRLLNAANARVMPIRIDGHRAMVMALDGQPAEPFQVDPARIVLSTGSRADLFIDCALKPGATASIFVDLGRSEVAVARLVYAAGEPRRASLLPRPNPLPPNPLPQRMDFRGALKMDIPLDGGAMSEMMGGMMRPDRMMHGGAPRIWALAGQAADGHSGPPLFSVKHGRTVMLGFPNKTQFPHNMHLHGHHFRLLDALDDGWKPWWLDTILVLPRRTERIAFVADNPGKWMLHCHMLEHQDTGMAAWFEVT